MARVYLMLEDLPDEGPDSPPFSWAVQWGTEGNQRPDQPTAAQFAVARFVSVLDGSFRADDEAEKPRVEVVEKPRIIRP